MAAARGNVNAEAIQKMWEDYKNNATSPSVTSALGMVILDFDGELINLTVPNQITENIIREESGLLEQIREKSGLGSLVYKFNIDREKFPELEDQKVKERLSDEDILNGMIERNPHLRPFAQKLGLARM